MRLPRVTIGQLMFGVAMLGLVLALLQYATSGRSVWGGGGICVVGLWPGLVAFGTTSFAIAGRRGQSSPFLRGFATVGCACVLTYLALCLARPGIFDGPISFYYNKIDFPWIAWLIDADTWELYMLNLLVLGLFLGMPQLIVATAGGLIARRAGRARWIST